MICYGLVDWLIRYPMTAVVTVVFTSCPTRGGQQRNQFIINTERHFDLCSDKLKYRSGFTMSTIFLNITFLLINLPNPA